MGRIKYDVDLLPFLTTIGLQACQIIEIRNITDNVFDWIGIIERGYKQCKHKKH